MQAPVQKYKVCSSSLASYALLKLVCNSSSLEQAHLKLEECCIHQIIELLATANLYYSSSS